MTKRLEILVGALPHIRRPAILVNPGNASSDDVLNSMTKPAATLGVQLRPFPVRRPQDLEDGFPALARDGVDAIVAQDDAVFLANSPVIAEFALRRRLPASGFTELAHAGGLVGYGVDYIALFHRAAYFIDKILKGADPGSLPIERATKFELVINVATAKALGALIPPAVVAGADEVIE